MTINIDDNEDNKSTNNTISGNFKTPIRERVQRLTNRYEGAKTPE